MLPPEIQTCTSSVACTLDLTYGAIVPLLVLVVAALRIVGVRIPDLGIFSEFVSQETIDTVEAEEPTSGTKPAVPDADVPNERTRLVPGPPQHRPESWRQTLLTVIPIFEIASWIFSLVQLATSLNGVIRLVVTVVTLTSWVYSVLKPNLAPSCTPYYDLLVLYSCHCVGACIALYDSTGGKPLTDVCDAVLTLIGICTIVTMPLYGSGKNPEVNTEGRLPALEDYCTLLEWMTFSWVSPLIAIGTQKSLEEKDVWQLSQSMQTKVLMRQFTQIKRSNLLRRLVAANARDMFLDLALTVVCAFLDFAPPVFLNLVLRAMSPPIPQPPSPFESYATFTIDSVFPSVTTTSSPFGRPLQRSDAYIFAIAAAVCQLVKSQCKLQSLYFGRRASVRIKAELVASVYEKALKRKDVVGSVSKAKGKGKGKEGEEVKEERGADAGRIVSLVAADAEWVARFFTLGSFIYDAPVSAVVACALLYNLMGWTAFVGYISLVLTLPINTILIRRSATLQKSVSSLRDTRMRLMNEALQSIKFIKYSAWTAPWTQKVLGARENELSWLWKLKFVNFLMSMMWDLVPVVVAAIGFSFFTLVAGQELRAEIAFPCLRIFDILTQSLSVLPLTVASTVRTIVSLQRIDSYLSEDEVPDYVSSLKRPIPSPHAPFDSRLGCANATFRWPTASSDSVPAKAAKLKKEGWWSRMLTLLKLKKRAAEEVVEVVQEEEDTVFELRDISVVFPEGVLSVIFGPTGSGKSSLLAAILGEMDTIEGEVYLPKEPTKVNEKTGLRMGIGYCAQQPWLEHKSIKDNILFGSPYDRVRYEATLSCCALGPDLAIFEDGDETEIGEKGVSLSGGQKARVALARAVYAPTQVVLLDDVLSAVDSHTAEHIIQRCLRGPLMKDRTVVLVTHHIESVLPAASWIIKLKQGRVEAQGTVEAVRGLGVLPLTREAVNRWTENTGGEPATKEVETKAEKHGARKLVEDETKAAGFVTSEVYKTYLSAASYFLFGILVLLLALDQVVQLSQKFWVKHWSESYEPRTSADDTSSWFGLRFPSASHNVLPYLLVYIGLQATVSTINVLSQIPNIWSTLRASRRLYERMLRSVMRSPSRFFDKTPSGRILNRFSKDVDTIDGGLQDNMIQVLTQALSLTVAVGTIVYAVPYFIVPAIVIAYLHLWFSNGYVTASRDLRRIEANTRSPIIASFSELVNGIVTVRAFGAERAFLQNMYKRMDFTQAATHYYWMCNRWLLLRFDALGTISILIATVGSVQGGASAGLTGIVITQAQQFVQCLYWGLRFWTELEQSLNSVERIKEYLDLPPEPPAVIESNRPPAAWPSATRGTLVLENLTIKYAPELEPVLKGISFATKPSEKIGIVGRTGSGKSTLALALLRFVDPTEGRIVLDGIDVTTIGLDDLRSRLALIPQDPVLFKGTIRDNLDPFNEHTDAECIQALQRVHLPSVNTPSQSVAASRADSIKGAVKPLILPRGEVHGDPETAHKDSGAGSAGVGTVVPLITPASVGSGLTVFTLETQVSEGGNNFSQGQRQLLSMARALLRKSNVIVMDESTASVDFETDEKIQTTIRKEFAHSILITIAHRLRTVIDNDRILVLSAGQVVEFDTPANLLKKENGMFQEMCKRSGDYERLMETVG